MQNPNNPSSLKIKLKNFYLPENYIFFIKLFCLNILMFAILRTIFMLNFTKEFHNVPVLDILKSFLIGARFDVFVINYALAPFFLVSCFPFITQNFFEKIKKTTFVLNTILFGLLYFFQLIDIEFFKADSYHLNYTLIEYSDSMDMALFMAFKKYHLFRYIFILAILVIFYLLLSKKFIFTRKAKKSPAKNFFIKNTIFYVLFSFLLVVGIRGGISLGIMEWGTAFFSDHNIINQATLNPIFNFSKDVYYVTKNDDLNKIRFFKTKDEALKIAQNFIIPESEKQNIINPDFPFFRQSLTTGEEKRYNVVILLMESMAAELLGCFGNELKLSPYFDELAENGVLFTSFHSNGHRTNIGISSTLCSYIPLFGNSIMSRVEGQQPIPSIASILKEKGYSTLFLYGGDLKFDNMAGFLRHKGFEKVDGVETFPSEEALNKWGVPDKNLFERFIKELDGLANENKPFFAMTLTLTNHPPYTIPNTYFGEKVKIKSEFNDAYNTFKYTDYELGKFFEQIKNKKYFKNTLFVILGDHSKSFHNDVEFDHRKSYVPCLFYAPKILTSPAKNNKISSQIDVVPTIFNILNMSVKNSFFGKNMFNAKNPEKDFAIIVSGNYLGYIKKDFFYSSKLGKDERLVKMTDFSFKDYKTEHRELVEEMKTEANALLETSFYLFKNKKIAKDIERQK